MWFCDFHFLDSFFGVSLEQSFLGFLILPFEVDEFLAQAERMSCVFSSVSDVPHECGTILAQNVSTWLSQEQIFDFTLNISDYRMLIEDRAPCRRALIWFLCRLYFPMCEDNQLCFPDTNDCNLVNQICNSTSLLNCTTLNLLPLSGSSCLNSSSHLSTEWIYNHPIPVTTCLADLNTTIPCCPDPFILGENGECVVRCPQPLISDSGEHAFFVISFVLLWIGTVLFLICLIPIVCATKWSVYPNYLIILANAHILLLGHTIAWSSYAGSVTDYLCGGQENNDFGDSIAAFRTSSTCLVQAWFYLFFQFSAILWFILFSLNLISKLSRFLFYALCPY